MEIPGLEPIDAEVFETLKRVSTATLATQLFKRGLRTRAMTDVHPIVPGRMVGEAVTLRYVPAREDLDTLAGVANLEHPQRKAIDTISPGQVLVCDARGDVAAGTLGDILTMRLKQRGAVGFVTDGAVRDGPGIRQVGLPCYARSQHPNAGFHIHHAADVNVPIGCGGVLVMPGDVIVGDGEGVVVIPRHLAAEVARDGQEQEELEAFILEKVAGGAGLVGTYPANEATRAEYQRWRAARAARG